MTSDEAFDAALGLSDYDAQRMMIRLADYSPSVFEAVYTGLMKAKASEQGTLDTL